MDYLNSLDDYKGITKPDKDRLWHRFKLRVQELAASEERTTLGMKGPSINLNTCTVEELRRIPKLTKDMQENLVQLRHVHSQGIRSWTEVSKIRGADFHLLQGPGDYTSSN